MSNDKKTSPRRFVDLVRAHLQTVDRIEARYLDTPRHALSPAATLAGTILPGGKPRSVVPPYPGVTDPGSIDTLAFYLPYHRWGSDWGIYVLATGAVTLARELAVHASPRGKTDEAGLLSAACDILIAHEFCHACVEAATSLIEVKLGGKADAERGWTEARRFQEESLCNAFAARSVVSPELRGTFLRWAATQWDGYGQAGMWLQADRFNVASRLLTAEIATGRERHAPTHGGLLSLLTERSKRSRGHQRAQRLDAWREALDQCEGLPLEWLLLRGLQLGPLAPRLDDIPTYLLEDQPGLRVTPRTTPAATKVTFPRIPAPDIRPSRAPIGVYPVADPVARLQQLRQEEGLHFDQAVEFEQPNATRGLGWFDLPLPDGAPALVLQGRAGGARAPVLESSNFTSHRVGHDGPGRLLFLPAT